MTEAGRILLAALPEWWHPINGQIVAEHITGIEAEARRSVLTFADALSDAADAYIEAVIAYLDPNNQFTESRRHAVQEAQERLGHAISVVQNIE